MNRITNEKVVPMNMLDLIIKKKTGASLSKEEIGYMIREYTDGNIPDYQMSAMLMAICFCGMDDEETTALTMAMADSGDRLDLSRINGIKVDKHSTGGVGDKITLVAGPLAAACGVPIAKMSGRGLGFTGGTIDKLESIPGFQTTLEPDDFFRQVDEVGISVIGQSGHIAPADKKLYALRDVTATVANLSLISSSIMSKKLAAGSDAIVLDVKCGKGAFMESEEDAAELARMMCKIGNSADKRTVAVLTDMNQPLGHAVGNAIEVIEAIDCLKGVGPEDVTTLALYLSGWMVYLGGKAASQEEGQKLVREAMESGAALEILRKMIKAQGGDQNVVDDYSLLPKAAHSADLVLTEEMLANSQAGAAASGSADSQAGAAGSADSQAGGTCYIAEIENQRVGICSQRTGAGREVKEDDIDPAAGVMVHKKIGDSVQIGDSLATFYGNDMAKINDALEEAKQIYTFSATPVEPPALIKQTIE